MGLMKIILTVVAVLGVMRGVEAAAPPDNNAVRRCLLTPISPDTAFIPSLKMGGKVCFLPSCRHYSDNILDQHILSKDRESLFNSLPSTLDEDGPEKLTVATFNVRGMSSSAKAHQVRKLLLDNKVDICGFQETCWQQDDVRSMERVFGGAVTAPVDVRVGGTAIISPIKERLTRVHTTVDGRITIVKVSAKDLHFQLVNVYAPATQNPRRLFMDQLILQLEAHIDPRLPIVLLGDFNFVENPERDRSNEQNRDIFSAEKMAELRATFDLVDIWEELSMEIGHTWHRLASGAVQSARLDRIYVSASLAPSVSNVKLLCPKIRVSDHMPLAIELCPPVESAPPRFRLNSLLLADPDILRVLIEIGEETIEAMSRPDTNVMGAYLAGKKRMVRLLRSRGRLAAHNRRTGQAEAEAALQDSFQAMNSAPTILPQHITEYSAAQAQVAVFEELDAKAAQLVAKERKFLEDEKSTGYFFRKAKTRQEQKKFRVLKRPNGQIAVTKDAMLDTVQEFYSNLFTEEATDQAAVEVLLGAVTKSFSAESKAWLDRPVTAAEVSIICRTLPANKSPGPDGLSYELFRSLDDISHQMLACLAESILHGPPDALNRPSFCEALIVLLPKKGDLKECKNWRPISLINADYKIIMALMATRLGPVMSEVIGEEQTGFVPGRSIFSAILAIKAALLHHKDSSPSGFLLMLDLEKAYDRVNHGFLKLAMARFGLPDSWIQALGTLYSVASSRVQMNGFLTDPIRLERGVRQGCPLSPMLFLFAIEPLACLIRDCPDLHGVSLGATPLLKLVLYADDTTLLLNNREELAVAEGILLTFEQGSGAKVNADKSELITLTRRQQQVHGSRFTLRPRDYQARLLGAMIGVEQNDDQNWEIALGKMERHKATWLAHGLSLRGKVLVAKTMILSQVTFLLHVQSMSDRISRKMDRLIALFIWGTNRQEFAARSLIQASRLQGGLDAPSVALWRQAIWRGMLSRLHRPGFWADLLAPSLADPSGIFGSIKSTEALPQTRRPKTLMTQLRPAMPLEKLVGPLSMLASCSFEEVGAHLPIRTCPGAYRKVFDVRWRLLTDCAVARHPPSQCPHCSMPDSTRHRFWDCPTAQRELQTARRSWPSLTAPSCIVFPPPDKMVIADALIWRVHLMALYELGILKTEPAPLANVIRAINR